MFGRFLRRCWSVLQSVWDGWRKHDGLLLSAATAYYATFSLFPLCLVLLAGLGIVSRHSTFMQGEQKVLLDTVSTNISPWLAVQLEGILASVKSQALLGGPMGLIVLLLSAIGIFSQLQNIFDRIWDVQGPAARGWLHALRLALWDRLLAFMMLLAIGAMMAGVFLADVVLVAVRTLVAKLPAVAETWQLVQPVTSVICVGLLLGVTYKVLPKATVRWKEALVGGLFAAIVWAIGKAVLLSFLIGEKYSAYGVIGASIGVMLWFYYASAVVFLGAEVVRALGKNSGDRSQEK
jgi:membrane protein